MITLKYTLVKPTQAPKTIKLLFACLVAGTCALRDHQGAALYQNPGYGGYFPSVAAAPYRAYADYATPPQPYSFGYDNVDEYGNRLFHSEQSDANNAKTGSYGYRDAYGLYRRVNYIADANGFRATVDTNEPGTAPGASADVVFNAAPVVPPTPGRAEGSATGVAAFAYGARGAAPNYSSAYNGYGRYGNAPYGGNVGAYGYGGYGPYGSASGGPALGGYAYGGYAPYGQGAAGYAAGRYGPGGYSAAAGWAAGQYGYRRR
ncbi:hypothetical protein V5799_024122 [Amblyomma americanum]|uniref:Cuticle protein n=1 Tax=Amblyomma americanum TaxID=6943 RepID=A0AAQ4EDA8_AMBAM